MKLPWNPISMPPQPENKDRRRYFFIDLLWLLSDSVHFIGKPVGDWLKEQEIIEAIEPIVEENYASI